MKHQPYCLIQNEKTKESFFWLGKSTTEGKWIEAEPIEYDGFKDLNDIIYHSNNPIDTLREIAKGWNSQNGFE
jgi:hypothetical protein